MAADSLWAAWDKFKTEFWQAQSYSTGDEAEMLARFEAALRVRVFTPGQEPPIEGDTTLGRDRVWPFGVVPLQPFIDVRWKANTPDGLQVVDPTLVIGNWRNVDPATARVWAAAISLAADLAVERGEWLQAQGALPEVE